MQDYLIKLMKFWDYDLVEIYEETSKQGPGVWPLQPPRPLLLGIENLRFLRSREDTSSGTSQEGGEGKGVVSIYLLLKTGLSMPIVASLGSLYTVIIKYVFFAQSSQMSSS